MSKAFLLIGTGAALASASISDSSTALKPDYSQLRRNVKKIMSSIKSNSVPAAKANDRARGLHYTDRYKRTTFLTGVDYGSDSQCMDSTNNFEFALPIKKYFDQSCWTSDIGGGYLSPEDAGHSSKVTRCMVDAGGNVMVETNVFENNMCSGPILHTDSFMLQDDNGNNIYNGNCSLISGMYSRIQCSMHYPFKNMQGYVTK